VQAHGFFVTHFFTFAKSLTGYSGMGDSGESPRVAPGFGQKYAVNFVPDGRK
jgi:hypothetical protein